jgi:hypothetical protein
VISAEQFREASAHLADVIGEHCFGLRERLVLDFIRRQSFGRQRLEAYVPSLGFFVEALGISRGNVCAVLKQLKRAQVIEERPEGCYGFVLPPGLWRVAVRVELVAVMEQLSLLAAPEHLRSAMRESFVESLPTRPAPCGIRLNRSGPGEDVPRGSSGGGVVSRESAGPEATEMAAHLCGADAPLISSQVVPNGKPQVPESGTAYLNREPGPTGSRIGNGPQTAMPARGLPQVPESGTVPFKALRVSAVQSSKTTETVKTLKGSDRELLARVAEHVGERAWTNWGGAWTNLVKRDAALVTRIVATFEAETREGRVVTNPGGWMWDLSKRWRGGA